MAQNLCCETYQFKMTQKQSASEPFLSNFIRKLVQLLNNKDNFKIVQWMPNGNGFKIRDLQRFTSKVLPHYYRHANMPSFVRQLNMYGFHKIKETDYSYYHHPYFKKDEPELYFKISRKPQKKYGNQNQALNEKQNSQSSVKQTSSQEPSRKKKKKVSFEPKIQAQEEREPLKAQNNGVEIMSNISIKFQQRDRNYESLLGPSLNCMDLLKGYEDDNVSIGNISDYNIPRAQQFLQSTHKIIAWDPKQDQNQNELLEN